MSRNWVPGSKGEGYFDGAGRMAGTPKVGFHTGRTSERGRGISPLKHPTRPPPRRRPSQRSRW